MVVDCTDAPQSRYLLNDAALKAQRPLVAASAVGLSGQLAIYNFEDGPCLRCAARTIKGLRPFFSSFLFISSYLII